MKTKLFYCFVSGLHFALLQFGYIYLLQIHITSTYLTFAMVTLAWMAGVLAGLWWQKGDAHTGLGLGLLSYFIVHLLTQLYPFSTATLYPAAFFILTSGFWAGRFFPFMGQRLPRMDLIFFHENNGFLLGIILCFAGITLWGRGALIWLPTVTGTALALFGRQPFTIVTSNTEPSTNSQT